MSLSVKRYVVRRTDTGKFFKNRGGYVDWVDFDLAQVFTRRGDATRTVKGNGAYFHTSLLPVVEVRVVTVTLRPT